VDNSKLKMNVYVNTLRRINSTIFSKLLIGESNKLSWLLSSVPTKVTLNLPAGKLQSCVMQPENSGGEASLWSKKLATVNFLNSWLNNTASV
jgi:hypothetical protein